MSGVHAHASFAEVRFNSHNFALIRFNFFRDNFEPAYFALISLLFFVCDNRCPSAVPFGQIVSCSCREQMLHSEHLHLNDLHGNAVS